MEEWKRRLLLLQETLEEWLQCQRGWMYLETIFGAPDITKQMPVEAAAFQDVDSKWKAIMKARVQYLTLELCEICGVRRKRATMESR